MAIAFITHGTSVSWTSRDGEERGTTDQISWKKSLGRMETPSGERLEILQFPKQAWEGHTVNGTATTSYTDFQEKLTDALG